MSAVSTEQSRHHWPQVGRWVPAVVLLFAAALTLIPILWMVVLSIEKATDILNPAFSFSFSVSSYVALFNSGTPYLQQLLNSLVIVAGTIALCVSVGSLAGYALSCLKTPRYISIPLLAIAGFISIVPPMVLVPGLYVTLASTNLIGGPIGLIFCNTVFQLPFAILVMKLNFDELPSALREAASIDGASEWRVFASVMVPLTRPGLASVAVFTAVMAWNEFQFGLTMTSGGSTSPLTVGIASLVNPNQVVWGQLAAVGVIAAVPIVVLTIVANRQLVAGLTHGAVKG